ncbi:MAG: HipA N-terminal domain-containing protein [Melioribacteraceae bacterium]|nr:HipA N-terminal domain-containing protein [Melioribacteraceae bacterium]MDD3559182.1 HipA N-terminal domain-containing protein [Melioribacteraceae bacterium]
MRKAKVYNYGFPAGELQELKMKDEYKFIYFEDYEGKPVSLTMPVDKKEYSFNSFPPFFEGLLPEGVMLNNLLRTAKIDADDYFSQLLYVGEDLIGSVQVEEIK